MTKKEKAQINDMIAYMQFAEKNSSFINMAFNIMHDLRGLVDTKDKDFLPRTHNWAKKIN